MLFRFSKFRDKSATSNRRCKVIYSYTQVNDDELTLAVGDVIEFLGEVRTRRVTGECGVACYPHLTYWANRN